jgi:putative endonuclease
VEVKTRRNTLFADPEHAVDWQKIRSLSMAASKFVRKYRLDGEIRFDIVTVIGTGGEPEMVQHIEDAFLPARF